LEHLEVDQDSCTVIRGKTHVAITLFAPELSLHNQKMQDDRIL
jgi:hypothetical protein